MAWDQKYLNRIQAASERGVSLVVVLWVVALLMIIATELVYTARVDSLSAANFRDEAVAQSLAIAGIHKGISEISNPYKIVALDGNGNIRFITEKDSTKEQPRSFDLGEGRVEYAIEDESGKLNLNKSSREVIVNMFMDSGVEGSALDTITDSILDWRDPNHEHHLNGAEDDYYSSLPKPYGSKDAPFDTTDELLLVRGVSPEIFYGSSQSKTDDTAASDFKGVSKHLTVRGDGRININTAGKEVLKAALGEGKANEILLRRATEDYYTIPYSGGVVSSGSFKINSTGIVRGIRFRISAEVEKRDGGVKVVCWKEEGIPGRD